LEDSMQAVYDFGIRLIANLQAVGAWQVLPMKIFSFLGTEEFYMLVLPVLYWCFDSALGMRVAVILMLSSGFNDAFKMVFRGPRPYWVSNKVTGFAEETSFGIPSGHSQNAVSVWGIMAARLRKGWAWIAAILIIFLIGVSRLSLGVHFPHDVLAGWLIGFLLLWLVLRFWDPVAAWAKRQTLGRQILLAFFASLGLLLLPVLAYAWIHLSGWQAPSEWASYATQAVTLEGGTTTAGTFFGLLAGVAWLARLGWFQEKDPWWKLVLRYLLGVAGVLAIRYGLKFIFPAGETLLAYFFRYVRYTLIGFWMTGGAPWVFLKLRLAEKRS
jgi:membrane-associated phospholipid phosphatase